MVPMIGQMADVIRHAHGAASNANFPHHMFIARKLPFSLTRRSIYTPVQRTHGDLHAVFATIVKLLRDGQLPV